jgi:hypothetical protein
MNGGRLVLGRLDDEDVLMHDMLYAPTVVQSRYCPNMPGVQMQYIGNGEYLNPITGEIYDFSRGFKSMGKMYGGGSIGNQTNADADILSNVPRDPMMFRRVQ